MQVLIDTVAADFCNSLRPPPHTTGHLIFRTCIAPIHVLASTQQPFSAVPAQPEIQPHTFILKVIPVSCIGSCKLIILQLVWPPLDPSAQLGLWGHGHTGSLGMLHQGAVHLCCLLQQVLQLCYTGPVLTTQLQQQSPVSITARVEALTHFAFATCSRAAQRLPRSGDTSRYIVTIYVAVVSCLALSFFLICVKTSPACWLADPDFDIEGDCCVFLLCCPYHVILQA